MRLGEIGGNWGQTRVSEGRPGPGNPGLTPISTRGKAGYGKPGSDPDFHPDFRNGSGVRQERIDELGGAERAQVVDALAHANEGERDRVLARDGGHDPSLRAAVELGEDEAGELRRPVEGGNWGQTRVSEGRPGPGNPGLGGVTPSLQHLLVQWRREVFNGTKS